MYDRENLKRIYTSCTLCPRCCAVNRYEKTGFCGCTAAPRLAKAMLHMWEEPVLCSKGGSGAVFFSGCTLKCAFCQNYEISAKNFGREVTAQRLSDIFLSLRDQGAQNIDLITATHYLPDVISALDQVKDKLGIPVVYNCGGYERPQTIRMLSGYVDIYLPDIKYFDDDLAVKFSSAPSYFETACCALEEMIRQTGKIEIKNEGGESVMKRGVIVRHMVLPSCRKDSLKVLSGLYERFGTDKFLISLLRQYTPFYRVKTDPSFREINRRVTGYEYDTVVNQAKEFGFDGFIQEKSSAKEEYTPLFDLSGI